MSNEIQTIYRATNFVIVNECRFLNAITDRVNKGEVKAVDELLKEKTRLDPKGCYDHEEVFIGTGFYLKGVKSERPKKR